MANTAGAPDPSQPQEKEERGRSQLPERQGRQKGRKGGRQGARQGGREGREIAIARCEVNAAASACERSSAWQRALLLLYGGRLLAGRGFKPDSGLDGSFYSLGEAPRRFDLTSYGVEASAVGRGRHWAESLQVLLRAHESRLRPTQTLFNIVLASCEHAGSWMAALDLLHSMCSSRIAGLISFNTCLAAAATAAQWQAALTLFQRVLEQSQPDPTTITSGVSALAKGQQWHRARDLLQCLPVHSLRPNQVLVNAAISAAEAGHQWPWALELLRLSKKDLRPTVITYNSTLSACGKASEWQRALVLLGELRANGRLEPDSTSYGAAILATLSARPMEWAAAFSLLTDMMERQVMPQLATCALLLMECELRALVQAECALLLALPDALEASLRLACVGTSSGTSATREDVSLLVLQVAAQRCLLSGDTAGCMEFLRRLDATGPGHWNAVAEGLWLRAHNAQSISSPELHSHRGRQRLPKEGFREGLRAGRAKELRLCRHVFASASAGDAWSVCEAMEDFGHRLSQQGQWLKLAAGAKGGLLVAAAQRAPAGPALEIGTYCGYSALRLALAGRAVVSLETDPIHAVIARNIVMMAGLDHLVDVRIGHSKDLLPRLAGKKFAFVFMDQKGSRFHEDLQLLADQDLLCDGAVVVADRALEALPEDNVLKPGAPIFLYLLAEAMKRGDGFTEIDSKALDPEATRKEVQRLKMDRAELLAKLTSQQEALDKVNFEIKQHSQNVAQLKERSQNLEEMMTNMDQADAVQIQKATQESERIQSFFASMNKEIQKAREKKTDLDARIAQLNAERQKEEQRAKNQAQEARAVAMEVEQANTELRDVKQEISKLNGQIQAQQSKEEKMKSELQKEQARYQQELKDKAIREQQIEGLTTELAAKSKAASSLEAQYIKLQRKARAAKRLLEKEQTKAKEQEQEAQKQLEREKEKAEAQARDDAAELQRVQQMLQKEAKMAKESFAEEVKHVEQKHLKEVQEQKHKIEHQVEIEKGQIMEEVSHLEKELAHEQQVGREQAAQAAKKEDALRVDLRKTKEVEEDRTRAAKKHMTDLQTSLEKQRKASAEKVQAANQNLQKVQEEVVEEEQALASKKAELHRVEKEAKSMEERADMAERQAQQKEARLQAKIRAANLMERRGKTALQRQAEHQAAKLKKMIADEKSMEREQVAELEAEIRKVQQAENTTKKVQVHAKFLRAK
ncbi:Comt [Symbiodinium natans]|uniref:catechol O-methyltransferase n=1 Tax=Symbiodinium natans TaxID=878477 RepID=A0A812Q856_9DINO|nr:Comt [Symbiodinium natans]